MTPFEPGPYLLRLALVLPLLCALVWASLWAGRRWFGLGTGGRPFARLAAPTGFGGLFAAAARAGRDTPAVPQPRLAGGVALGPGARLIVVDFGGRALLLHLGRGTAALIAEAPLAAGAPTDA